MWGRLKQSFILTSDHRFKTLPNILSRTLSINKEMDVQSIHSNSISEVHEMPMDVIIRPLISEVKDEKVESIMKTLEVSNKIKKKSHDFYIDNFQNKK